MSTFRLPRWYFFPAVALGMTTNYVTAYQPSLIPFDYMGPVGVFLHYMAYDLNSLSRFIFIGACVIHVGEGLYALYLCRRAHLSMTDQCLWFMQTMMLGFSSLGLLKKILKKRQN